MSALADRVCLEAGGTWSGGGGVLLRNLAEVIGAAQPGDRRLRVVARNAVGAELLRSGRFLAIPQNALPWRRLPMTGSELVKQQALRAWSEVAMRRARGVVRISESIPLPDSVRPGPVVHNVLDAEYEVLIARMGRFSHPYPYLACVGSLHSYRNLIRTIRAHARLRRRVPDAPDLVIAGWPHPRAARAVQAEATGRPGVRVIADHLPRREALEIVAGADLVLLPSLVEASPVTLLEAVAVNGRVVLSDIPGHRGIADFHGLRIEESRYFDPCSVESMATAMVDGLGRPPVAAGALGSAAGRLATRRTWREAMAAALEAALG